MFFVLFYSNAFIIISEFPEIGHWPEEVTRPRRMQRGYTFTNTISIIDVYLNPVCFVSGLLLGDAEINSWHGWCSLTRAEDARTCSAFTKHRERVSLTGITKTEYFLEDLCLQPKYKRKHCYAVSHEDDNRMENDFTVFDFSAFTSSVPCLNMTFFFLFFFFNKLVDSLYLYTACHHLLTQWDKALHSNTICI